MERWANLRAAGSGVDFNSATDAAVYFECVNANRSINGRPVEYVVENDVPRRRPTRPGRTR